MTAPRLALLGAAAIFSTNVSIDPEMRPTERPIRPRVAVAAEQAPTALETIDPTDTPVPAEVRVEATVPLEERAGR